MEKASTTPNRLTRSAAKQVNVTSKNIEESLENQTVEDVKHSARKSRRKTETKPKTNGDTLTNVDKTFKHNNEEYSDNNSVDGCGSEDSNTSAQLRSSPKSNNKSSPPISRKSLRTRRSVTPGPELEYSASKKMKRSTSEGKLESVSTPKGRRSIRAKSESKDFVFTPTKNNEKINSLSESNSKLIHRNSKLRVIDENVESDDDIILSKVVLQDPQIPELLNNETEHREDSHEINLASGKQVSEVEQVKVIPEIISNTDTDCKTDVKDSISEESDIEVKDTCQRLNQFSPSMEENSDSISQKSSDPQFILVPEVTDIEKSDNHIGVEENVSANKLDSDVVQITSDSEIATKSVICDYEKVASPQPVILVEENEEIANTYTEKLDLKSDDSIEIDITADECESQEVPKTINFICQTVDDSDNVKTSEESPPIMDSEIITVTENNNLTTDVPIENESLPSKEEVTDHGDTSDSKSGNSSSQKLEVHIEDKEFSTQPLEADIKVASINESEFVCKTDITKCDVTEESEANDTEDVIIFCRDSKEYRQSEEVEAVENTTKEINKVEVGDGLEFHGNECNLNMEVLNKSDENTAVDEMQNQLTHLSSDIEEREGYNIHIENTCTVDDDDDDDDSVNVQYHSSENVEITQDPLGEELSESAVVIEGEPNRIEILNDYSVNDFSEGKEENIEVKLCEQNEILGHEPTNKENRSEELQSEEVFEEDNYDDIGSNKVEDDSGSDSDIYKGLSDFGTDGEEKKDGSQFDENVSSESITGASEDYGSSGDGEEEQEECVGKEDIPCNDQQIRLNELKMNKDKSIKTGEEKFDTNSPMTYDKALAILNKNRVKKIDDEEFFDMFTQELNRVSEESGSDSDIAIVDEYIMEPEEPAKKPNPQTHLKPPLLPNQSMQQPPEHFSGAYNQQVPNQHNHPMVAKMSFTQGALYHQYNQNMPGMPPVNAIRGPIMYDQYAPPPTSMPDPRMYNPHIPPDVNFSRAGMFSHHLNPVSEAQLHYQTPSLKIRNINTLKNSQTSNPMNTNYNPSDPASAMVLEMNAQRESHENEKKFSQNVRVSAATMTETNDKLDQATTYSSPVRESDEGKTSILEILGLNKEKLNLLKEVLGLKNKSKKAQQKSKCTKKSSPQGKRIKSRFRAENDKKRKSMLLKEILENNSTFANYGSERSSSENFTEETASSYSGSCPDVLRKEGDNISSDDSSKNINREINIEGRALSVTFKTHSETSPRREIWEHDRTLTYNSSDSTPETIIPLRKKRKRAYQLKEKSSSQKGKMVDVKRFKFDSSQSLSSGKKSSLKMVQAKKQSKKEQKVLKSNSGMFTVDSVSQSQSSESEMFDDENQDSGPSNTEEELSRKARSDMASGKNKLSNLFSQRLLKESNKRSKNIASVDHSRKHQERPLKKLPQDLLEELAKEERKVKKAKVVESVSEDSEMEKPRKKRKRSVKVNIKSVAAEQDYIPCVTSGATQFGLSRLDKDSLLSTAEKAAKFRTDRLYGSPVKRITSEELLNIKKRQKWTVSKSLKKTSLMKKDQKK